MVGIGSLLAGALTPLFQQFSRSELGSGLGDVAGTLLGNIGLPLIDAFGLGADGGMTSAGTLQNMKDQAADFQRAASWSAAGYEGEDANRVANAMSDTLINTNSADAWGTANTQRNLASQMLGSQDRTSADAMRMLGNDIGNQRRDVANAVTNAGGGVASIVGANKDIGRQRSESVARMAAQNSANAANVISGAGQLHADSQASLQGDRAVRKELFDPYAVQKYNGSNLAAAGQAANQAQQASDAARIAEDPMALAKSTIGSLTGQGTTGYLQNSDIARLIDLYRQINSNMPGPDGQYGTPNVMDAMNAASTASIFSKYFPV